MSTHDLKDLIELLDHSVAVHEGNVEIKDEAKLRARAHHLAATSAAIA